MQVKHGQIAEALAAAGTMTDEELRREAQAGRSRSYYIRLGGRTFPMKAIIRLAYRRAAIEWDGPQSKAAAAMLRDRFDIIHSLAEVEEDRLERQRESVLRWARPGQGRFRAALLELYDSKCVISGCDVLEAIDASHIIGVAVAGGEKLENGWIIRADLHRLFDEWLMSVDPVKGTVHFAKDCLDSYPELEGRTISLPKGGVTLDGFRRHWNEFQSEG